MWERLKDILYEVSDIIFALIIILLMATIITWKITDSLAYSKDGGSILYQSSDRISKLKQNSSSQNVLKNKNSKDEKQKNQAPAQSNNPQEPPADIIQIDIPAGISCENIATILKDQSLIQDTDEFILEIEQKQLSNKLRSGSFQIKIGSSLDEIINILIGHRQ